MTTTHTPGPWSATGYHVEARAGAIATVCDAGDGDTEGDANARLMAAAPDLLAALRGVMAWWADTLPPHGADDEMPAHLFDAAHAAIARATGANP